MRLLFRNMVLSQLLDVVLEVLFQNEDGLDKHKPEDDEELSLPKDEMALVDLLQLVWKVFYVKDRFVDALKDELPDESHQLVYSGYQA